MFGILNINKPGGCTSRDVVNRLQRLVRPAKVGHAGTLDPLATGVLVVCVGPATRLIRYVQEMPKSYRATFLLGVKSPSDDVESEVTPLVDPPQPTRAEIEARLPDFLGCIEQRPPMYSALKINGQRAYKLARQGKQLDLPPRVVEVYHIEIDSFQYPQLQLTVKCGSGTYLRSLGRDLAVSLGTQAVMSELVRTAIGSYRLENASALDLLTPDTISDHALAPLTAVAQLPRIQLDAAQLAEIRHGRLIAAAELVGSSIGTNPVIAATNPKGDLVALLQERRPGMLGASCNIALSD